MNALDQTFAALSDPTRRGILEKLKHGEATLSQLAAPLEMSQTAVSKHVRVLSEAGLVVVEKRGRSRHCRLEAAQMQGAADWLRDYEKFWTDQLASLGAYLAEEERKK